MCDATAHRWEGELLVAGCAGLGCSEGLGDGTMVVGVGRERAWSWLGMYREEVTQVLGVGRSLEGMPCGMLVGWLLEQCRELSTF